MSITRYMSDPKPSPDAAARQVLVEDLREDNEMEKQAGPLSYLRNLLGAGVGGAIGRGGNVLGRVETHTSGQAGRGILNKLLNPEVRGTRTILTGDIAPRAGMGNIPTKLEELTRIVERAGGKVNVHPTTGMVSINRFGRSKHQIVPRELVHHRGGGISELAVNPKQIKGQYFNPGGGLEGALTKTEAGKKAREAQMDMLGDLLDKGTKGLATAKKHPLLIAGGAAGAGMGLSKLLGGGGGRDRRGPIIIS
jgi:hypothetical protein